MKHEDALAQLARETRRARRALAAERAMRAGLWLAIAAGAWAAFALFGLHARLPELAQSLSAIAALIILAMLALRARRHWRRPSDTEARARLAADSRLDAGAFEALRDQPTRYDALAVALWRREQEHARERVTTARARGPRADLDSADRYKLRYVVGALFLGGAIFANVHASERLAPAFLPDPGPLVGDKPLAVEAWVTPADYTHAAPISLSDHLGERIETPPSVEATVRVTGPVGAPVLVFAGARGEQRLRFSRAADGAWEAKLVLPGPGVLRVVRFHTRAFWRMAPAADRPPAAAFTAPVALLANERAMISWRAHDDFGIARLALRARPVRPPIGLIGAPPFDSEFPAPAGDPRLAEGESELDLAAHPYAGMEVELRLVAFDALGQEGVGAPLRVTLPEKIFLQPLARAALQARRQLVSEQRPYRAAQGLPPPARAPPGVRNAARLLDALTMKPRDGYFRDMGVFLGLRMARAHLETSRSTFGANVAADILWRTALRAEYGSSADARRALMEAQRALAEALAAGAPRDRIAQLTQALREAAANYMRALTEEALREGQQGSAEDTEEQTSVSQDDIQDLLQRVEELNAQGRTREAQQMLSMLSDILNNMDAKLEESREAREGEQNQQMQQSMDALSEAIGEQRQLNEETRERGGGGGGGSQQGGQGGDDLAERQADIRESLGQAQRDSQEAGVAPSEDLQSAARAMGQSENALRQGDLEGAQAAQGAALESLREGAEELAGEMRDRARRQAAREGGAGDPLASRDPLGRRASGEGGGDGETQVPTTLDPAQSRAVQAEIRRRAEDPNRPAAEREYLQRLLNRFEDD